MKKSPPTLTTVRISSNVELNAKLIFLALLKILKSEYDLYFFYNCPNVRTDIFCNFSLSYIWVRERVEHCGPSFTDIWLNSNKTMTVWTSSSWYLIPPPRSPGWNQIYHARLCKTSCFLFQKTSSYIAVIYHCNALINVLFWLDP